MATKKPKKLAVKPGRKPTQAQIDRETRKFHGQLGDVELRSDVDAYIRDDPVARLGWTLLTRGLLGKSDTTRISAIIRNRKKHKKHKAAGWAGFPYDREEVKEHWKTLSPKEKKKWKALANLLDNDLSLIRRELIRQGIHREDLPYRSSDAEFPMFVAYREGVQPGIPYGQGMTYLAHELHHIGDTFLKGHKEYGKLYPYKKSDKELKKLKQSYEWQPEERRAYYRDFETQLRNLGDPFASQQQYIGKHRVTAVASDIFLPEAHMKRFDTARLAEKAMRDISLGTPKYYSDFGDEPQKYRVPPKVDPYEHQRFKRYHKHLNKLDPQIGIGEIAGDYAIKKSLSSLSGKPIPYSEKPFSYRSPDILKKMTEEQTGGSLAPVPGHPPTKNFLYKDAPPMYDEKGEYILRIGETENFSSGGTVKKKKKNRTQKRYNKKQYSSGGRVAKYKG